MSTIFQTPHSITVTGSPCPAASSVPYACYPFAPNYTSYLRRKKPLQSRILPSDCCEPQIAQRPTKTERRDHEDAGCSEAHNPKRQRIVSPLSTDDASPSSLDDLSDSSPSTPSLQDSQETALSINDIDANELMEEIRREEYADLVSSEPEE